MQHPDYKYIEALHSNDEALLKELYHKCFGRIKNFVLKNNGTADDAWDLLQEAMLAVYYKTKHQQFALSCPFDAFIFIVCRNLWIKSLRNKKSKGVTISIETVLYDIPGDDIAAAADECRQQAQRKKLFDETLLLLGDACRQLLKQSWQGRHLADIAAELKFSYGYARKKKTECMAKLVLLMKQSPAYSLLK